MGALCQNRPIWTRTLYRIATEIWRSSGMSTGILEACAISAPGSRLHHVVIHTDNTHAKSFQPAALQRAVITQIGRLTEVRRDQRWLPYAPGCFFLFFMLFFGDEFGFLRMYSWSTCGYWQCNLTFEKITLIFLLCQSDGQQTFQYSSPFYMWYNYAFYISQTEHREVM